MSSFRLLRIALLALPFLACSNDSPPTQPEDPNSIEAQIRALFQPGATVRDAALTQLSGIRQEISTGTAANARSRALTLVDFTMTSFREGRLVGGSSESTGNAVSKLVDAVYQLVGMDPPRIPAGALSSDGEARIVGPSGGEVVTPSGAAGVVIPPGALNESVLIAVTRLPNTPAPGTGPLPTTLKQYPPYYDFAAYPNVPQFGDSMRVGVCQVTDPSSPFYPPEPHSRLRLAHSVGASVEVLEPVNVNDFLRCPGTSPGLFGSVAPANTLLRRFASSAQRIVDLLRPAQLYAAHGGLGGKVRSFSPFGAVDILSGPVATVTVSPSAPTVVAGQVIQLTATTMDGGGTVVSGRTISWTSSNPLVASVSPSGAVATVTGLVAGGPVTITAISEGRMGTASVTVVDPTPVIQSATRQPLGNFLTDPLPPTHLPRGGRYRVVVSGSALSRVTGVSFANSLVTGIIRSVSGSAVAMDVFSTQVDEGNTAAAALGPIAFTLTTSDGVIVSSQGVTVSIVEGPVPIVTRLVVTNGVTRLKAGDTTVVAFEGEAVDAGNTKFVFIAGHGVGTFGQGRSNFQGNSIFPFTVRYTPTSADATQVLSFGVIDGAGHAATRLEIVFPVDQ